MRKLLHYKLTILQIKFKRENDEERKNIKNKK